jgi:Protein of unknown function (DUF2459)
VRALVPVAMAGSLSGCAMMPTDGPVPNGTVMLYVVDHGWHTDVGIPVQGITGPLALLTSDFAGIRFAMFGFGERHYYMAHHPGSGEMLLPCFRARA